MSRVKLTDLWLKHLSIPENGRMEYSDAIMPCLYLRVSAAGSKTFSVLMRQGRLRRSTIGRYPILSLVEARGEAMRLQRDAAEKRLVPLHAVETLADVTTDYVNLSLNGRVKNWATVQRMLERPVLTDLRAKPVASITRRDVVGVLDTLQLSGTRTEAENMLKQLKALFNWALSRDSVATNPCHGIRLPRRTVERDRVLADTEIAAIWRAATQLPEPWPGLIRILILTGQRRCEVSGMSWAEIENTTWLIARERVKKDRPHAVPLTEMALEVLNDRAAEGRSGFVFSSDGGDTSSSNFSKIKAKLDVMSGVTGWVLHDLRRTVRSKMAELGVPREVARKVLNHEDGKVDRIYNRHEYLAEKREALERWERMLLEIVDIPGNSQSGWPA